MKTWFLNSISLFVIVLLGTSCEKQEVKAVLTPGVVPVVTTSAQTVVLTKENADKDALTVSWAKPDYGFAAPAAYTLLIDKKGGDFSKAEGIATGAGLTKTFKASELNAILLKLGLKPATAGDVDIRVQSAIGPSTVLSSALSSVKVTPYLDKLDLSSTFGIVGSATANGWDGPDQPFYRTDKAGILVAYLMLANGDIKFRQDNKWDVNYGGTNGVLKAGGDNITVKAGSYKVTFDTNALTYKVEPFTWGVIGNATANGWDGPDQPFFYDPSTDQWRAIVRLVAGDIKFRLNNDWGVNYGDTGADGVLESGGDNIAMKAGTYLITADFKSLKYTIVPYKVWGLVGSAAPKGWDGPDTQFTPDFGTEGIWRLTSVKLVDGDIKFRQNNDWAVNYGGANGVLKTGGDNIAVKAGTYDILLDLTNASAPTYKLTKK
ncbi:MAG: SusE domain-containing protein [Spirosoma sp.]|nr:SusE domain-containing protein [Spirosoma sp.]